MADGMNVTTPRNTSFTPTNTGFQLQGAGGDEVLMAQVLAPGRPGGATTTPGAANNIVPFNRITPVTNPPAELPVNPATGRPMPSGGSWYSVNGGSPVYVPPNESLRSLQRDDFFFAVDTFYQRIFQAEPNASVNGVTRQDFVNWRDLSRQGAQGELSPMQMERLINLQNKLTDALSDPVPAQRTQGGQQTQQAPATPRPIDSPLTLGDYQVNVRNTGGDFSVAYQIGGRNHHYDLRSTTREGAAQETRQAFEEGRLPGLTPPARQAPAQQQNFDSPLTLGNF